MISSEIQQTDKHTLDNEVEVFGLRIRLISLPATVHFIPNNQY